MIPVAILMLSGMALVQFFMSYARSILASYAMAEIAPATMNLVGAQASEIRGQEFHRLLNLVRLAPNPGDDKWDLRIVRSYFSVVNVIGGLACLFASSVCQWRERESDLCSKFALAVLDRRIAAVAAR
ncbi:MAG TPA: hypothetical protein VGR81_06605 [Candidatus Acidoferrales bacterium]|nr:hypothetical protein [Candidatus Acidoferrales bacterium]